MTAINVRFSALRKPFDGGPTLDKNGGYFTLTYDGETPSPTSSTDVAGNATDNAMVKR